MTLANYTDAEGRPICPVCGKAIKPEDNAARPDGCIVHLRCLDEARRRPQPCEPSPS